jgi:hypothetical protein
VERLSGGDTSGTGADLEPLDQVALGEKPPPPLHHRDPICPVGQHAFSTQPTRPETKLLTEQLDETKAKAMIGSYRHLKSRKQKTSLDY